MTNRFWVRVAVALAAALGVWSIAIRADSPGSVWILHATDVHPLVDFISAATKPDKKAQIESQIKTQRPLNIAALKDLLTGARTSSSALRASQGCSSCRATLTLIRAGSPGSRRRTKTKTGATLIAKCLRRLRRDPARRPRGSDSGTGRRVGRQPDSRHLHRAGQQRHRARGRERQLFEVLCVVRGRYPESD